MAHDHNKAPRGKQPMHVEQVWFREARERRRRKDRMAKLSRRKNRSSK